MTATPHSSPDPLAALPLLREAGVSVYWQPLEGRTAWVADVDSRQVWISRAIPRHSVLSYLIQALQAVDDGSAETRAADAPAAGRRRPGPRLVHSADTVEHRPGPEPPALHVVHDA